MAERALAFALVIAGVTSFGCGDGGAGATGAGGAGGSATCASNASCGGNIVGSWAIVQACSIKTSVPPGCAEETHTASNQAQTGTIVFRADGTATETLRTTGTIVESSPPACLASAMETCADVDARFKGLVQSGSSYTAASCADNAGTCVCTLMFDTTSNVSGTYATSGSTLTVTSNGDGNVVSYCVTGSTLILGAASTTGDPPAVYVLARQ